MVGHGLVLNGTGRSSNLWEFFAAYVEGMSLSSVVICLVVGWKTIRRGVEHFECMYIKYLTTKEVHFLFCRQTVN